MAGNDALSRYLTDDELRELIAVFPDVEFAFAYGSGVVEQEVRHASPSPDVVNRRPLYASQLNLVSPKICLPRPHDNNSRHACILSLSHRAVCI